MPLPAARWADARPPESPQGHVAIPKGLLALVPGLASGTGRAVHPHSWPSGAKSRAQSPSWRARNRPRWPFWVMVSQEPRQKARQRGRGASWEGGGAGEVTLG